MRTVIEKRAYELVEYVPAITRDEMPDGAIPEFVSAGAIVTALEPVAVEWTAQ